MRIGHGYDVHAFGPGCELLLGGVAIPYSHSLVAHSDGDVVIHALMDSLLGALCLGDIGSHFPDTDVAYFNSNSRDLLIEVVAMLTAHGYRLVNADITIIAQSPKMAPYLAAMRSCLATDLNASIGQINVKATTTERLGFVGRSEGIASHAVVLVEPI
ncbi:MAG: 2-C-methyl-D-erythritol 2,4-cyclodiphosphate synthase [Porticoccaceae bacterium]|nr:2-C-methyl-D-erythritol 2,4-cyclodiphosphate synthase [Porticoccaceae bacterium]